MQTLGEGSPPNIALGQTNWDQPVNILRAPIQGIALLIVSSYLWLF